ncbi:MAG: hypothetical protein V2A73_08755 [Pseudomonadota bacterium]
MKHVICDDCHNRRRLYTLWVNGRMVHVCAECERRRVGVYMPEREGAQDASRESAV